MSSIPPPPNTVGIPLIIGKELRQLYTQIVSLTNQLQQKGFLSKADADLLYSPPIPFVKTALQAGSPNQLDVTGLGGLLAQPQQGGAPLLPTAPIQGSPAAQDGAIYRTVTGGSDVLRFWNAATEPGVDTPISAAGIVTIRKNNTTTIGSSSTLDFLEGTGITLTMALTGSEVRITPSINSTLASIKTASAVLDFPSTSAQSSSDLTISVTGAALSDVVILGIPNASVNANSDYNAWVSSASTVSVRFNNYSTGAIDPASGTFKIAVLHF